MPPLARPLVRPLARHLAIPLAGSAGGDSDPIPAPPVNTLPPSINGELFPGETITCDPGLWEGEPSFTYQWYVNDSEASTEATLEIPTDALGVEIYCVVTATNDAGSTDASTDELPSWSPFTIPGVAFVWWSAANVYNSVDPDLVLAEDNQTVRRWEAAITTAPADQTSETSKPKFYATDSDFLFGRVSFDGSNDTLILSGAPLDTFRDVAFGYIFAGVQDTDPSGGSSIHTAVEIQKGDVAGTRLTLLTKVGGVFAVGARREDGDTNIQASGPATDDDYHVFTAEALWGNGVLNLRIDGSQVGTANFASSGNTSNTASLNAGFSKASNGLPGNITAVIFVTGELSASERSKVERWISFLGPTPVDVPLV